MATENTTITPDQFVPPELWGRDHFSTLAYIETRLVDGKKYSVQFDPRMRQNRRNYRMLAANRPSGAVRMGIPMSPEHGSRLADGTYLPWHDDWCCVQDLQAAGLIDGDPDAFDRGFRITLTPKGHDAVHVIREHKAAGGNFTTCAAAVLLAIGYQQPTAG